MNGQCRYLLDWHAGSSAEIDLRAAREGGAYYLRYASPFRSTMRAPSQEIRAGAGDLKQINDGLNEFAARVFGVSRSGGKEVEQRPSQVDLKEFGQQLFEMVLPPHVQSDLRKREFFIEIGTDDKLLHYPWELMHDGDEFLCLKHYVGRFVNLDRTLELNAQTPYGPGYDLGDLRVLVISVPQPKERGGMRFERLAAAENETQAIVETLGAGGLRPEILRERGASLIEVIQALRRQWHIIHFAGHAFFDPDNPRQTALVLDDENITVGRLAAHLQNQRSVLCIVNACETTRGTLRVVDGHPGSAPSHAPDDGPPEDAVSWTEQYDIYGLARAFLETGAYLLGSRWKLNDKSAELFARTFYSALVIDGQPIGQAITAARTAVREAANDDDLSWASYVYYGDPRVCVKRQLVELTEEPAVPAMMRGVAASGEGAPVRADAMPTARADPETPPEAAVISDGDDDYSELHPLNQIAREYESIRSTMASSHERTRKLSALVEDARRIGVTRDYTTLVPKLFAGGEGDRIVALALIQARPHVGHFAQVHDAIGASRTAFEQYHGLAAARLLCDQLSAEQATGLSETLRRLMQDVEFFGTDRFLLANDLLSRLGPTFASSNPDFQ